MPIYIMKNYLKLIIRSKWIVGMMIMGPIIIIAIVSSAFQSMLKSYEVPDEFMVGYYVEEDSMFREAMMQIKEEAKEAGISLLEYPSFDKKDIAKQNQVAAFVAFHKDSYTLYQFDEYTTEGSITEYFLNQMVEAMTLSNIPIEDIQIDIPDEKLETIPDIDSEKYYGIIYVVYFVWCSIVTLASVISGEVKNDIQKRFHVSGLTSFHEYIAKLIPCILATIIEMGITIGIAHVLLGLNFGNLFLSVTILIASICAASVFGLALYYIVNNIAVAVILEFTICWVLAFAGGTFEAYFTQKLPEVVKLISPIYHTNRALVELYCYNKSEFVMSAILYSLAIVMTGSVISIGIIKIRKR